MRLLLKIILVLHFLLSLNSYKFLNFPKISGFYGLIGLSEPNDEVVSRSDAISDGKPLRVFGFSEPHKNFLLTKNFIRGQVVKKNKNIFEIYAPLHDEFSFSSLNLYGRYRKIILDISKKEIKIEKNVILEQMNLEFPIKWKDHVLLVKVIEDKINELVLCKNLEIIKNIKLPENRFLCGEPKARNTNIFRACHL